MNTRNEQEILEEKATRARERLLAVVDQLDRKRHQLSHPMNLVKKQLPDAAYLVAAGIAAVTGLAAVATVVVRARAKRRRELRTRFRIERTPPLPGFTAEVGGRAARALITFGLVQLGKTVLTRAMKASSENRNRLPGRAQVNRQIPVIPRQPPVRINRGEQNFQ